MEYSVSDSSGDNGGSVTELAGHRVTVEVRGVFASPRVLIDGVPVVKNADGAYPIPGSDATVLRLKSAGLDVVPQVEIRKGAEKPRVLRLASPLSWFVYAWACLPLFLLLVGGAIGGGLGAAAAYANLYLFRSQRTSGEQYGLSGAVTLAAFLVYAVFAVAIRLLLRHGAAK